MLSNLLSAMQQTLRQVSASLRAESVAVSDGARRTLLAMGMCSDALEQRAERGVQSRAPAPIQSALASAAPCARAPYARGELAKWIVFTSLTFMSLPVLVSAQTVADQGGLPTAEQQWNQGRGAHQTAARVSGGVLGALLGAAVTEGSGGLARAAAVIGLGYLGQTMGGILTQKVTDQDGNPVIANGVDANGRPQYLSVSVKMPDPGAKHTPDDVSTELYQQSLRMSSDVASLAQQKSREGADGRQYRPLDAQAHADLYTLMVETVSYRLIATQFMREMDSKAVALQMDAQAQEKQLQFAAQKERYEHYFSQYQTNYLNVHKVLQGIQQRGFDVMAQRIAMDMAAYRDLKVNSAADGGTWPGVGARVLAILKMPENQFNPMQLSGATGANDQSRLSQVALESRRALDVVSGVRAQSIAPLRINESGQTIKPLDETMRTAIYRIIVKTAAYQGLAYQAFESRQQAQLQLKLADGDKGAVNQLTARIKSLDTQYSAHKINYEARYKDARETLALARENAFDVDDQYKVMLMVPREAWHPASETLKWPGVAKQMSVISGKPVPTLVGGDEIRSKSQESIEAKEPVAPDADSKT